MDNGTPAGTEIKNAVAAICNGETVRPLTDLVSVEDPDTVSYDIELTYYLPSNITVGSAEIEAAVEAAVDEYKVWQSAKFGRDINPSYLMSLLMKTGIKRAEIQYPEYASLSDGSDDSTPEVASADSTAITNGGFEDE